jgi:ABC-type antimicrobial peptide transport system permease subunit
LSSVEKVPLKRFLIKAKSGLSPEETNAIVGKLRALLILQPDLEIWDYRDSIGPINQANSIMTYFFNFTTIIAMLISFFSLMSSMYVKFYVVFVMRRYTNVWEQTKEIGVLRALGVHKSWMYRIYIYEAFILVFSASIMGIMIGTIIGNVLFIAYITP